MKMGDRWIRMVIEGPTSFLPSYHPQLINSSPHGHNTATASLQTDRGWDPGWIKYTLSGLVSWFVWGNSFLHQLSGLNYSHYPLLCPKVSLNEKLYDHSLGCREESFFKSRSPHFLYKWWWHLLNEVHVRMNGIFYVNCPTSGWSWKDDSSLDNLPPYQRWTGRWKVK